MKIDKNKLQKALEIVKPGLANKELIEQSTSFAFVGQRVVTYNDEISISHPIEGMEINGAIKADKLYAFLGKIKKEQINVVVEGNELLLSVGKSKAGFALQEEIKLPLDEEVKEHGKWYPLPKDFLRFMEFTVPSCSRDSSKPIITCVHVNKNGYVEASDDYRITRCELNEEMPVKTFLIPSSSVMTMIRLKPTKIAEGTGWIHFRTPAGTIMSARLFKDKYPSTDVMREIKGKVVILPEVMDKALEKADIFAKRDHLLDEIIDITIKDNLLTIRAESDSEWFEERLPLKYEGDSINFLITPYLLKGILTETKSCRVSKQKLRFEGEGWVYVSMLRHDIKS